MMNRNMWAALLAGCLTVGGSADAQQGRILTPRMGYAPDSPNAARIGVYLGEGSAADTLGVLVSSVVADGPAAKAGIKGGDRIAAIGNVTLRMSRDDAADDLLSGMMVRRLTRELDKRKPGDEVELSVWSDGRSRVVRVRTVAASELATEAPRALMELRGRLEGLRGGMADRAALGITPGGSPSVRDTLGVFVSSVARDGPAEKAGIVEGDRIARINDLDLRVPVPEAGDATLSRARIARLTRELAGLKAGDVVTLTVITAGRQREVRVTAVKASELRELDLHIFPGDRMIFRLPRIDFDHDDDRIRIEIRERIEEALDRARDAARRVEIRRRG